MARWLTVRIADREYNVEFDSERVLVNGRPLQLDAVALDTRGGLSFHRDGCVLHAVLDYSPRESYISLHGREFPVEFETERDRLLKRISHAGSEVHHHAEIRASMPGLVLRVPVIAGKQVYKGDAVLILEAMKMENEIRSPVRRHRPPTAREAGAAGGEGRFADGARVKLPEASPVTPDASAETSRQGARSRWLQAVESLTARHPERRARFETDSHIEIARLYEPDTEFSQSGKLGYPGFYPFTRGIHPNLYRGKLWTMRQYAGFGTAEESNARYKYLLAQGTTGLSVAFDLPTQIGYDSDHPAAAGEVGRVGVAVSSLDDMLVLFDGIPLEHISTSMTINATAAILMGLYIAVARQRGIPENVLSGTVQNDILKEYIARGTYIFPPRPSMRLTTDIIAYCRERLPQWNTMSISGYHIREAGANAVQELAFTFANAIAYVEAAQAAGLAVDEFAPRLAFFWGCHNNLFEEVAKFRASRRIWARILRERFGARDERSLMLRFHTQTAGCSLTAQQPMNNAVRVTIQALAAVLGGTQSLHTNAIDEALSLPTEESARLALRTQQIIAHESGVADTVDPIGGSYFVEALTDRLEIDVLDYLRRIDELGGAITAIEKHYFQNEIAAEAYRYQSEIETGGRVIVGVNRFTDERDISPPRLRIDPAIESRQKQRLAELRRSRDNVKVTSALDSLRAAVQTDANLMPLIIHAVEQRATLGEIADNLRTVWGEFQDAQ